jgi:asparagine synthase (glutamine-hydrolysing)
MCGILGIIGARPNLDQAKLEQALDILAHRGPNDRGTFSTPDTWFGHRRLSIIDLTSSGHQPMVDQDSGCVISYNGEIYNYLEIKSELQARGHNFKTASDTEVLLKAYVEWGIECLPKLNGMWAFSIWDPRDRSVFLARDRFGVKPLYYTTISGAVSFASEPKALLAIFPDLRMVNKRTLYRFFAFGELYSENESFYKGIKILPPATFARISVDCPSVSPTRYWELKTKIDPAWSQTDKANEFPELFQSAVKLRLRSDVPVGLSLSGGIDSSSIMCTMADNLGDRLVCLTAVYGQRAQSEFGWASIAAAKRGALAVPVEASAQDWLKSMNSISWHMDAPGYSPAVYPTWKIMEAAKLSNIPVMLEGQGADEAFGGYPQYAAIFLLSVLRDGKFGKFLTQFTSLKKTFPGRTLPLWMLRELFPKLFKMYQLHRRGHQLMRLEVFSADDMRSTPTVTLGVNNQVTLLTKRLFIDFTQTILPGLLHYGDAISMGQSIESRLPFMDYRLVEWIFSAPDRLKIDNGITKVILRKQLREMGLGSIADRPDKKGYPTPVISWLIRDNGAMAKQILLQDDSKILQYCSRTNIQKLIDAHIRVPQLKDDNLYKLVSTELWLRACIHTS